MYARSRARDCPESLDHYKCSLRLHRRLNPQPKADVGGEGLCRKITNGILSFYISALRLMQKKREMLGVCWGNTNGNPGT